jgi:hypothetical protein
LITVFKTAIETKYIPKANGTAVKSHPPKPQSNSKER